MSSVSFQHVSKVYPGGITAVRDFSLEIQDKEFVALLGPSGSGKTAVLRLAAGLEDITEGELYFGDQRMNRVPPKDRDAAMVLQDCALYPRKTAYENMAYALRLRRVPRDQIQARVEEAAAALDITSLLGRRPKALSGGQRQRVALGRALVREPRVFLLDAPLNNLDAGLRARLREELARLPKRLDAACLCVMYDQSEAMALSDRLVILRDGVLQQADAPQICYDFPANKFVAGFLGTPPMNFLDALLTREGGRAWADVGGQRIAVPSEVADRLAEEAWLDGEAILGIRPEHLSDDPDLAAAHPDAVLEARAEAMEQTAGEACLTCAVEGQQAPVMARANPHAKTKPGDAVRLAVDPAHLHFFRSGSEETLLRR